MLARYNPNNEFREFRRSFDILNSMLNNFSSTVQTDTVDVDFTPAVNIKEEQSAYYIELDLPGMKKKDINIKVEDNALIVSGERKMKKEEDYYKIESSYGTFKRVFTIPEDVDVENIKASATDGVLEIVLPKVEVKKPEAKSIEIK
jgi:HSP20 family protein